MWFDSVVAARDELARAPDQHAIDLGGSLFLVERRHVPLERGHGVF